MLGRFWVRLGLNVCTAAAMRHRKEFDSHLYRLLHETHGQFWTNTFIIPACSWVTCRFAAPVFRFYFLLLRSVLTLWSGRLAGLTSLFQSMLPDWSPNHTLNWFWVPWCPIWAHCALCTVQHQWESCQEDPDPSSELGPRLKHCSRHKRAPRLRVFIVIHSEQSDAQQQLHPDASSMFTFSINSSPLQSWTHRRL